MIDKLIEWLQKKINEIEIDNYDYETRIWSKGFKKGAQWSLERIKEFKELIE